MVPICSGSIRAARVAAGSDLGPKDLRRLASPETTVEDDSAVTPSSAILDGENTLTSQKLAVHLARQVGASCPMSGVLESQLLLGAILGIALYNVTNGTPTGFRYSMPGLAFFAVSAALLIARADLRPEPSPDLERPSDASRRSLSPPP